MTLAAVVLIISSFYGLLALLLCYHLRRLFLQRPAQQEWEPLVSVIIAIRDEAPHLNACLESLAALDYPLEKLEIILIDDDSSDGSGLLLDTFCASHPGMHVIHLNRSNKELPGKAGAIFQGIKICTGEVILLTDADCRAPSGWIRHLLAGFSEKVGLVGGFTFLLPQKNADDPLDRIKAVQALDWLFLLGIAAAAIKMGKPLSWMGNNMAFRRQAYDEVGGYPALGHSLIEDFALLNAISRTTGWEVRIVAGNEAAVASIPVKTVRALYNQRRRWALGIKEVRPFGKLVMVTSFLSHFGVLAALFCCSMAGLTALLMLLGGDLLICHRMTRETQNNQLLQHYPEFELFYFAYCLILPVMMIFDRHIRWKDQDFPAR